jgi:hypothetical protein
MAVCRIGPDGWFPELKLLLIELSQNWLNIALQLERTHALLDENPPPKKPA